MQLKLSISSFVFSIDRAILITCSLFQFLDISHEALFGWEKISLHYIEHELGLYFIFCETDYLTASFKRDSKYFIFFKYLIRQKCHGSKSFLLSFNLQLVIRKQRTPIDISALCTCSDGSHP